MIAMALSPVAMASEMITVASLVLGIHGISTIITITVMISAVTAQALLTLAIAIEHQGDQITDLDLQA